MEVYANKLVPCKSCNDRSYVFFPRPHDPAGHKLYIRAGKRSEVYRVTEAEGGPDGRAWRVTKASTGETYTTYLAANGSDRRCGCPGYYYGDGGDCRHLAAVRDLLTQGAFDGGDPADSPLFADLPADEPDFAAAFGGV